MSSLNKEEEAEAVEMKPLLPHLPREHPRDTRIPIEELSGAMAAGPSGQSSGPRSKGPGLSSWGPGPNSQGPGPSSKDPGPSSEGPGPSSQGPRPNSRIPGQSSQGPGPSSQGPGPSSQGPGPSSQGPGPSNQGPGPSSQGPGPSSWGPRPNSRIPGRSSQGLGPSSQGPGPSSQGPGPSSQGSGPSSQGLGPSSWGPGFNDAVTDGGNSGLYFKDSKWTSIEMVMDCDMEMLETILSIAKDSGVVDSLNTMGCTALHTAIINHNLPAIKTLLLHGASPHKVSDKEETALHVAIDSPDILKYVLDNTNVQSTLSYKGLAPEHVAINSKKPKSLILLLDKFGNTQVKTRQGGNTPLHLAAIEGADEMAKIILERDQAQTMFEVNAQGYTPLHLAAKHNNKELAALLLLNGANLSTKTEDGNESTVLELISTSFYDGMNFFERVFDGFIYNTQIDGKTAVNSDYKVLTNGKDMSQINVLEEFVKCDRSKALIHPLIESLLYLKWKHFQPRFFALLGLYVIFLICFNSLIVCIYYLEDARNNTSNTNNTSPASDAEAARSIGFNGGWYWLLIMLTYIFIIILVLQESMFIYLKRGGYFRSVESWVKLFGLLLCTASPPLAALVPGAWARQAACAALLLVWVQAMFLVSRFSRFVLMFGKVAVNVLKVLVTALFLVIAFAFCFMIQYHSALPFDDPFAAFVKTLVMMSSEFEYENLFDEKHDKHLESTKWVVRILFVVFVVFVAIVLMNFMIGVAVSDINDLNETGKIRRLEKQVELLSTFELLADDGVLAKWFKKLFGDKKYHSLMYTYRGHKSIWHVEIRNSSPDVACTVQIRSSKLYNAIVEIPSKQQQQDQEAAKHNAEKPYRCLRNASHYEFAVESAGARQRGEDDDSTKRKENQYLSSLTRDSSKMSRDIDILKQRNEDLNLQILNLSAMSSDILRRIRPGPNWMSLARMARRRPRRTRMPL